MEHKSKQHYWPGRLFIMLIIMAVLAAFIPQVIQAEDIPWVKTDQADYMAGSTVTLTGGCWTGDSQVEVNVYVDGNSIQFIQQIVDINSDGTFSMQFGIYSNYIPLYHVVARGINTGRIATTSFTDKGADRQFLQFGNELGSEEWVGGNVNSSKADLTEGMSVPQRLILQNLSLMDQHIVTFEYAFTQGGKYAYDFITSWDQAAVAAHDNLGQNWTNEMLGRNFPAGLSLGDLSGPVKLQIPDYTAGVDPTDPYYTLMQNIQTRVNAYEDALGYGECEVYIYYTGGTLTSPEITLDPILIGSTADNSSLEFSVKWSGTATTVMILYASHIAVGLDPIPVTGIGWGEGMGANSISGSPYHNKLAEPSTEWTGTSEDNQIQTNAILYRSQMTGSKFLDVNADGDRDLPDDIGLSGWTIWLDLDDDGVYDPPDPLNPFAPFDPSAITDANGLYSMNFYLPNQTATILYFYENQQPGYMQTCPIPGNNYVEIIPGYSTNLVDFGNTPIKPSITVTKTADDTSIPESGQDVVFTITIKNNNLNFPVTVTKIEDDKFGDLLPEALIDWVAGGHTAPIVIAADGSWSFDITRHLASDTLTPHINIVTVTAEDKFGQEATDDDDETVNFYDELPVIILTKTASPLTLPEPGGTFTYTYSIHNDSVEKVMLTKVMDDVLGTLYEWKTGDPEIWIAAGGDYLLPGTFTKDYTEAGSYTNIAWAYAVDNEGNEAKDDDTKTVEVTDVLPVIILTKTASPLTLPEPGGTFTYTYSIHNDSVEKVMLTKVTDDVLGTLYEWKTGDPVIWIDPQGDYLLPGTFSKTYTEAGSYTNIAWAYAVDNEGNEAKDDDTKTVEVTDVLPVITVTKAASVPHVLFPGEWVTFSGIVTNKSVEAVKLTSIIDDIYGDLADSLNPKIQDSTVTDLPKTLAPDATYAYSFKAYVTGDVGSDQKDTITATAYDNEGNPATASADATVHIYTKVKVLKTVNGLPFSGPELTFQLRQGASMTSQGTILETKYANVSNGGKVYFDKLLNPGTYQLVELIPVGYVPSYVWGPYGVEWFRPGYLPGQGGEDPVIWVAVNFIVNADGTITFQPGPAQQIVQPGDFIEIDNQVGQMPFTIGFWKNHAFNKNSNGGQEPYLDRMLYKATEAGQTIRIGTLALPGGSTPDNAGTSSTYAVRLLNKSTIITNKKMASDPAFNCAAQLLGYRLNQRFGAWLNPIAGQAADIAQTMLVNVGFNGQTYTKPPKAILAKWTANMNYLAKILDAYNNGTTPSTFTMPYPGVGY